MRCRRVAAQLCVLCVLCVGLRRHRLELVEHLEWERHSLKSVVGIVLPHIADRAVGVDPDPRLLGRVKYVSGAVGLEYPLFWVGVQRVVQPEALHDLAALRQRQWEDHHQLDAACAELFVCASQVIQTWDAQRSYDPCT